MMVKIMTLLLISAGIVMSVPVEQLVNNGFEDGILTPWTTDNWVISTDDPYSGTYCAFTEGNNWVRQEFAPVDVTAVTSVTFWYKQPEIAIFAYRLYYSPSDYDQDICLVSSSGWVQYDLTSVLRPAGELQGIQFYGYSGGGTQPDYCYIDDVSVMYDETVTLERTTFGAIKAAFGQ